MKELIEMLQKRKEAQQVISKEAHPKKDHSWDRFPGGEEAPKRVVETIWNLIVENGAGHYRRRHGMDDTWYLSRNCEVRSHYFVNARKTDYWLTYWPASNQTIGRKSGLVPQHVRAILERLAIRDPADHRPSRLEIGDKQFRPVWFSASRLEPVLAKWLDEYTSGDLGVQLRRDRSRVGMGTQMNRVSRSK